VELFHYTDADAVKSIIENERLWFTDFRFLNDSQELHEGFAVLAEILNDPNDALLNKFPSKEKILKHIKANLFQDGTYYPNLEPDQRQI